MLDLAVKLCALWLAPPAISRRPWVSATCDQLSHAATHGAGRAQAVKQESIKQTKQHSVKATQCEGNTV